MREVVTERFKEFISSQANSVGNVAVIGGNSEDPEVATLTCLFPEVEFHYFNITNSCNDANFHALDLNESNPQFIKNMQFDLVISSQVLEHIRNHDNYFKIVVEITKPTGLIWLNCPKSNMVTVPLITSLQVLRHRTFQEISNTMVVRFCWPLRWETDVTT